MTLREPLRLFVALVLAVGVPAGAQSVMGSVSTHDARVTGGLEVRGEQAQLISNAAVTAFDHTAPIALARGGEVLVCSTSQFHLLHSGTGKALLFGLDRGAVEVHGAAEAQDVLLTPDIRFVLEAGGSYDLRVRVTANGDTCVENRGPGSPVLMLADPFSSTSYRVVPGQHVLFEHGSLREVVDKERSACGCPAVAADARTPAEQAHPFPEAASAGLAPVQPPANSTPDGVVHAQVTDTLSYNTGAAGASPGVAGASPADEQSTPAAPVATTVSTAPPETPPGAHDIAHAIGHFLRRIFHPVEKTAP